MSGQVGYKTCARSSAVLDEVIDTGMTYVGHGAVGAGGAPALGGVIYTKGSSDLGLTLPCIMHHAACTL